MQPNEMPPRGFLQTSGEGDFEERLNRLIKSVAELRGAVAILGQSMAATGRTIDRLATMIEDATTKKGTRQ